MAVELHISEAGGVPERDRLSLGGWLLLWAARRAARRSGFHRGEVLRRATDPGAYDCWRAQSLRQQLTAHFEPERLGGKDVVDFGCGKGELSVLLASQYRCRTVTGVDLSARAVEQANRKLANLQAPTRDAIRFVTADDDRRIEMTDESVDVVCCFDVVEHIPHPEETAAEWRRVLRPGGEVWIWWSPWRGPYGHHVESLIPLPWIHLVFRPRTVFAVCAALYDDPGFVPRTWDIDPATGAKHPNKWRTTTSYEPFLNRLTRGRFERTVCGQGLTIAHRETHGFGRSRGARVMRALTRLPVFGECFASFFIYRLVKRA